MGIDIHGLPRPRRGRLHLAAALASVLGLVVLVRVADTGLAHAAAWVYGIAAVSSTSRAACTTCSQSRPGPCR